MKNKTQIQEQLEWLIIKEKQLKVNHMEEELNIMIMVNGDLSVTKLLEIQKHQLCANKWDMIQEQFMVVEVNQELVQDTKEKTIVVTED
jgi:hypothetical protein